MELRQTLDAVEDLEILYVLPQNQINAKTLRFIDGNGLRERVRFLADPDSAVIDLLGLRRPHPEPMEAGVPHPATYVLDREGIVQLFDVRQDYHIWLDSRTIASALAELP